MGSVTKAMDEIIGLGVGLFILVLILALTYQGYAQTANSVVTSYGSNSGVYQNFTKNGGNVVNTYGSNLTLVVFALVFLAIIAAILIALKMRGGREGGFLS
jgi:hypothetical protein